MLTCSSRPVAGRIVVAKHPHNNKDIVVEHLDFRTLAGRRYILKHKWMHAKALSYDFKLRRRVWPFDVDPRDSRRFRVLATFFYALRGCLIEGASVIIRDANKYSSGSSWGRLEPFWGATCFACSISDALNVPFCPSVRFCAFLSVCITVMRI